jgi:hypothetical protein
LVVIYFGRHSLLVLGIAIGISRPNLDPTGWYCGRDCTDGWFIGAYFAALWGNGHAGGDGAGGFEQGDRVGVLLDLGEGSLRFFKNGMEQGPGYAAGSMADRPGSCSSATVQPQRERVAAVKRTAARVNDLQGRRRYLSIASKGAKNQDAGTLLGFRWHSSSCDLISKATKQQSVHPKTFY